MKRRVLHAGLLALFLICLLGGARSAPPAVAATPAATLTLSPASGAPGTIVALSIPAGGLPANDEADVLFQDATNTYLGLLLFRGMTGPDGSFNARVPMAPEAAAGTGRIFVNAAGNITTSAPFTVLPSIQVLPNPIQAGTGFQVVGNGFSSGYPITIQQDNGRGLGPQPLTALGGESTYANALGNFTALLILDKHSPVGSVQISATDLVLTATTTLQTTDPNALSSAPIIGATPPFSTTVGQVTGTPPLAQTTPMPPTVTPVSGPGSGATGTPGIGNAPSPSPTATSQPAPSLRHHRLLRRGVHRPSQGCRAGKLHRVAEPAEHDGRRRPSHDHLRTGRRARARGRQPDGRAAVGAARAGERRRGAE